MVRSVGQLGKLQIGRETTFGVPATTWRYFGKAIRFKPQHNPNYGYIEPSCSRQRSDGYITKTDYGFTAECKFTSQGILSDDINYVLSGEPFSAFIKGAGKQTVDDIESEYVGLTGCVLDTMTIKSSSIATPLVFELSVMSKYASDSRTRIASSIEGTEFAPVALACTDGIPYKDGGNAILTVDGIDEEVTFDSWTVSIKNNCERRPGYVTDANDDIVALSAGAGIVCGVMNIEVSISQLSINSIWNTRKLANVMPTKLVFPLNNGGSITLTDLFFTGDNLTEFQAGTLAKEDIVFNAKTIVIA
jgi:hypothetical protein